MNNDKKLYKDYFNNIKPSQKLVAETKKLMRAEEQKKSHKQRSIFTNPVFMGRFRQYGSFAVSLVFALSATLNVADIKPSLPTTPPEITTEETVITVPTTETTEYSEPAITTSPEKNEPQVTTCDTYKDTDITEKQTDNNITTTGVSKTDTSKVTVKTDENFVITKESSDTTIPEITETSSTMQTSGATSVTTTDTKITTVSSAETTIISNPDTTTSSSKSTTVTAITTIESSDSETETIVTTTTPKFTTTTPRFTTTTPEIITVTPPTTASTIDTSENNITTSTTNHSDSWTETVTTPHFTTTTPRFTTTTPRFTTTTPYFPTAPIPTTTPESSVETTCTSETTETETTETTRPTDSDSPVETTIYNSDFHSYNINCATGLQYLKYESLDTTKIYTYDELTEIFGGSFLPDEFLIDNIQYDYSVTFADKTVSADDSSGLIYFYGDYDETFLSPFLAVRINTDTKFNFMNIFTFEPKTRYYSGAYGIIRQLQIYKVSDNIFSDDPSILVAEFNIFRNGRKVNFQITASQVSTAQFIATLEKFFERLEYL